VELMADTIPCDSTNQLYTPARQRYLTGGSNWDTQDVHFYLVTADYTFDPNHTLVADIPIEARVASAQPLDTMSENGWAKTPAVQFTGVSSDVAISYVIIAQTDPNFPTNEEARLLEVFYDDVHNLPTYAPAGGTFYLIYDSSFGGLFRL